MDKKKLITNKIICGGFILYALFLSLERIISTIVSFFIGEYGYNILPNNEGNVSALGIINYIVMVASLVAGIILLVRPITDMFKVIFKKEIYEFSKEKYFKLFLGIIVLLVSGMVHTHYTIGVLQGAAYLFLIVATIAKCVQVCFEEREKRFNTIISLIYLTCFSMAIPVVYRGFFDPSLIALEVFYPIAEYIAILVLIPIYGLMLLRYFNESELKFKFFPLILLLVLVDVVFGLGFVGNTNYYAFSFSILTLVAYLVKIIVSSKSNKKIENKPTENKDVIDVKTEEESK